MKQLTAFLLLIAVCIASGCSADESAAGGGKLQTNSNEPELYNPEASQDKTSFGYVRHRKEGIQANSKPHEEYTINREQTADIIARMCTNIAEVDDVSVLVTDEEVLIVYDTESTDKQSSADQVMKTAFSIVPGWYDIYVTDNTFLRQDVENFATLNTHNSGIDQLLEHVIKEMGKSPQGESRAREMASKNESQQPG